MYDPRIVMDLVHRYGRACGEDDYARAGVLFSEITRAITDEAMTESFRHQNSKEAPRPSEDERGALAA